jgi:hypothetical protein
MCPEVEAFVRACIHSAAVAGCEVEPMTDDRDRDHPIFDLPNDLFTQSPSAEPAPQQQEWAESPDSRTEYQQDETQALGNEFGPGEKPRKAVKVVLAIVGIVALALLCLELFLVQRATDAARRAAEAAGKSAEAAKASADLAQKTLQTTTDNFRLNTRAWLYVSAMSKPLNANEPVIVVIHGQNGGKTAARKVEGVGIAEVLDAGRQPDFIYRQGHPRTLFSGSILEPDNSFDFQTFVMKEGATAPVIQRLAPPQVQAINTGKATLFAHGEISFKDVFADEHWVKYCFVYIPSSYAPKGIAHFGIPDEGPCKEHNDMDDSQ